MIERDRKIIRIRCKNCDTVVEITKGNGVRKVCPKCGGAKFEEIHYKEVVTK